MMRYFTILIFTLFFTLFATQESSAQRLHNNERPFPEHVITQVSPNPVLQHATIRFENPKDLDLRVEIYNIIGNNVATFTNDHNRREFAVDASSLDEGMYFYFVFYKEYNISTGRMMVKR